LQIKRSMSLSPRVKAFFGLAGLSIFCGIAVHLVAELAALGRDGDASLIFSARHIPLALLALASLGAVALAALPGRPRLPACGGLRLFLVTFSTQFLVFSLTEAGEGLPVQAGDLGLALVAALAASVLGALLVVRYEARVLAAVAELFVAIVAACKPQAAAQSWKRADAHVRVWRSRAVVFVASLRPPPSALVIEPLIVIERSQEYEGVSTIFDARSRTRRAGLECRAGYRFSAPG
jgi:hypothetical protein